MIKRGLVPIVRKLMCSLGYHRYHPSVMETKYIRNEGKFWVYEMRTRCMYCEKPFNAVFSIAKPIKEERDG